MYPAINLSKSVILKMSLLRTTGDRNAYRTVYATATISAISSIVVYDSSLWSGDARTCTLNKVVFSKPYMFDLDEHTQHMMYVTSQLACALASQLTCAAAAAPPQPSAGCHDVPLPPRGPPPRSELWNQALN